jgi:hypothetical protein
MRLKDEQQVSFSISISMAKHNKIGVDDKDDK